MEYPLSVLAAGREQILGFLGVLKVWVENHCARVWGGAVLREIYEVKVENKYFLQMVKLAMRM